MFKFSQSTEAADAFVEAIQEEAEVPVESLEESYEESPVSWSEDGSAEMMDDMGRLGIDSGIPPIKMAAYIKALDGVRGPHSELVKEAVVLGLARRGLTAAGRAAITGGRAAITGARGAARAGRMAGKGTLSAMKGVNQVGKSSRNFLRSRGKDLSLSGGDVAFRAAPELGFQGYHLNSINKPL